MELGGPLLYRTFFLKNKKRGFTTLLKRGCIPTYSNFFWAHFVVNVEFPNPKVGEGEQWHEAFGSCHREVGGGDGESHVINRPPDVNHIHVTEVNA